MMAPPVPCPAAPCTHHHQRAPVRCSVRSPPSQRRRPGPPPQAAALPAGSGVEHAARLLGSLMQTKQGGYALEKTCEETCKEKAARRGSKTRVQDDRLLKRQQGCTACSERRRCSAQGALWMAHAVRSSLPILSSGRTAHTAGYSPIGQTTHNLIFVQQQSLDCMTLPPTIVSCVLTWPPRTSHCLLKPPQKLTCHPACLQQVCCPRLNQAEAKQGTQPV